MTSMVQGAKHTSNTKGDGLDGGMFWYLFSPLSQLILPYLGTAIIPCDGKPMVNSVSM